MAKFELLLHGGNTYEEILGISQERIDEIDKCIQSTISKSRISTQPEALQIVCSHCDNINELVYWVYLTGKQHGEYEALFYGPGNVGLRMTEDGGVSLISNFFKKG